MSVERIISDDPLAVDVQAEKIGDLLVLHKKLIREHSDRFYPQMLEFAAKIRASYPDTYANYKLWHLLVLSTINELNQPNFDFPDELSVEKFLLDQHNQISAGEE